MTKRRLLTLFMLIGALVSWSNPLAAQTSKPQAKWNSQAYYIEMDDGVKIAADVYFPTGYEDGKKYPAILELTRYWRGSVNRKTGKVIVSLGAIDRAYLNAGYLLVKVDVRGSGASFGTRQEEYGPREIKDGYAIVDWVSKRPWCDGKVGAQGISYTGTTAELICASKHPALKAVIPGWSDFDVYESPARPYGLNPSKFIGLWGRMVGMMDSNDPGMGGSVRPVTKELLEQAISAHRDNPNVGDLVAKSEFRDTKIGNSAALAECSSRYWRKQIEASNVPMLVFASWLDAGTADGALMRFKYYRNPQKVVILASNHGGSSHASPFVVERRTIPTTPNFQKQIEMRLAFFDRHLKGKKNEVDQWPSLQYFNMGEEKLRSSESWPPKDSKPVRMYFSADQQLLNKKPDNADGFDRHLVDFKTSTGRTNRWMTQMGGPVLNLHRRERMDRRMLTYTSAPLEQDLQITGWPEVSVELESDQADGALLCYLEAVAPGEDDKAQSIYVTEGGLRLIHRKVSKDPDFESNRLYHSFNEGDAEEMKPGEVTTVAFKLWPTSVRIPKGYRIRIAIAGHDDSVFERIPAKADPTFKIYRNRERASFIDLPIVPASAD